MPSCCAVWFIIAEKPSIEPPTPSASTTAMSLADFTIIILSALSMVSWVPGGNPILEGDCEAATGDTVNSVSSDIRPSFTAFSVTYAVMILVTEAGYQGMVALSACSTLPVSASTTSSASACATRGVTTASAAARKIQFREWRGSRRRRCTFPFRSFETRPEKGRSLRADVRVSSVSGAVALRQGANLYRLGGPEQGPGD